MRLGFCCQAAAALRADAEALANDRKTLGLLFENLALRELSVYAQASGADVMHYRDNSALEVDAIVSTRDGKWAGVEIKLGVGQEDAAAKALTRLANKIEAGGGSAPQCLVVLVGLGAFAHQRQDGVSVVPIDTLGP
ncbi:MAG: DUF4143 domain-containing protein [Propionibacteriaceae bacterium]|nr:DUF4143 domain-containing protein [Propionibacteriaceae bacterium]